MQQELIRKKRKRKKKEERDASASAQQYRCLVGCTVYGPKPQKKYNESEI